MKYYLIGDYEFPFNSAIAKRYYILAKGLQREENKITIICNFSDEFVREGSKEIYLNGIRIVGFQYSGFLKSKIMQKSLVHYLTQIRTVLFLRKEAEKKLLILNKHNFSVNIVYALTRWYTKSIIINDIVEDYRLFKSVNVIMGVIHKIDYFLFFRFVRFLSDGAMCITSYLRIILHAYYRKLPTIIVPPPIDNYELKLNSKSKSVFEFPFILYVGTMNEKDGLDDLILSLKYLSITNEIKLVIICNVSKEIILDKKTFIAENGLEEKVIILGYIPDGEIDKYYQTADILAVTRPDTMKARCGFPSKLVEYLNYRKPILATKVGDIPLYFTDEEDIIFVQPNNPESIAAGIEKICSSFELMNRLRKNTGECAKRHFDNVKLAKQVVSFASTLIKE